LLFPNRRQCQKNAAVRQIHSADDVLDAIHEQRTRCLKENLVIVGIADPCSPDIASKG
jgi:hypothetical protein